ncbi:hypothetical protein BAE44_0007839 [Dichanthelium oligosanthes]|uniref:Uncharacterized protein n=1 Tax=Dichanthelium oligosanthes TaxID=888268 RepID=A0A1E5W1K7_9POAL|nr:hypothetical protein BAE44_0007839 [Dichanthelium oligosanthes]
MEKRKNTDLLHEPAKKHKVPSRMATKNSDLLDETGRKDESPAKIMVGRSENLTSRFNPDHKLSC